MNAYIGEPSVRDVIAVAAELFDVQPADLTGRDRHEPLNSYRKAAMVACRIATSASYPTIGDYFGRNHTTAVAAIKGAGGRVEIWAKEIAREASDRREGGDRAC